MNELEGRSSPQVLVLVGPTGVGKTALAIEIADLMSLEVVSLDSRQMYRRLNIGTAKPSAEEQRIAPHHLVDVVDPESELSLAEVQAMAYAAIDAILGRDVLPVLAGGTGQYMRAVVQGWQIPAVPPDRALRQALQQEAAATSIEVLFRRLAAIDPISADKIGPRNLRRIIRALEVHHHTGEPISAIQGRSAPRYEFVQVGLERPRAVLYERIDARIDRMIDSGLEAEVKELLAQGLDFDRPAMSGLGYREWRGYFAGEIDHEAVVQLIRRNTRRLVRSQSGWFRRDDDRIYWVDLEGRSVSSVARDLVSRLRNPV